MKIKHLILFVFFAGMSINNSIAQDISAKQIVKRADDLMQGKSNYADIKMIVHRSKWERSLLLKSWMKGTDYALIYITEPAKEKGQVFLKREKEMWNWLPSIDRMIKLPPSMMMQSWMGSDITNDDLVNESSIVDDYTHKILNREIIQGEECYKIELIPDENAAVVWGKVISWISVKNFYTLKNEYYDEDDFLVNTETLSNIKAIGDRTIPTKYTIVPADEDDQWTSMEFVNIKFNINIEDSFFSIQNMKRVR
jgi:outer membrane lipoprotein-sorting protein